MWRANQKTDPARPEYDKGLTQKESSYQFSSLSSRRSRSIRFAFGLHRLPGWVIQQQQRFDDFLDVYNNHRPHQALGGLYPGEVYTPSPRQYRLPPPPDYPFHDRTVLVTQCGRICIGKRKINLNRVFAGQYVGVTEVDNDIWLVSFMDYDLGFFDQEVNRVEPVGENPFAPKLLPMSPV